MREAWKGRAALDEPVVLEVHAVAARPKRLMRKSDPDGRVVRTTKPDGDNVLKSAADALVQAGVLRDDVVVVIWTCVCEYAAKGEEPRVEVRLTRLSRLRTKSLEAA
jgi:Holliday junction resolvase RusA-like endonuclease